jgi:hypothetical protein
MMDIVYGNAIAALPLRQEAGLRTVRLSPDQIRGADIREAASRLARLAQSLGVSPEAMAARCKEDVDIFDRTSTLDDQLGKNARRIYELGRCLVSWNKDTIAAPVTNRHNGQ